MWKRLSLTFPRDKLFSHTPSTSIDSIQSLSPTSTTGEKELPLKSVERRQSLPSDETFILAIIGKPNVGKSTITCTGLRNLAPIKNVGVEQSILKTPSFISEIEVDDSLYPVEVMELREDVFDMRSEIEWPRDLPEIDGVLVCYDCENRDTIANIAWLLSAFKEFEVPAILVATKSESPNRRVDTAHGTRLGGLFNVGFVELDTANPQSTEKIHDVFSMLLRLAIRRREFQKQRADKRQRRDSHDTSISELDIIPFYKHKRTSSDVSHNNHTRKKKELGKDLSRSWRSNWRYNHNNSSKSSCLSTKYASDDESTARVATCSLSRSLPRFIAKPPEISITPPHSPSRSPPTSAHTSPTNRISHPPHRRALLPYSTLLQVKEIDEETSQKDTQSTESRMSTDSSFSIASDGSANWDCMFQMDPVDKSRRPNSDGQECGLAINELIDRLTCGGEYGTHEDPFVITFFCVYRTFMKPREVLEKLIEKYESSENVSSERGNPAQQKICSLIYHWITKHPQDLIHLQTRALLRSFLQTITSCSHLSYYAIILEPLIMADSPTTDVDDLWGNVDIDYPDTDFTLLPHSDELSVEYHGEQTIKHSTKTDSGFANWFNTDVFDDDDIHLDIGINEVKLRKKNALGERKASLIVVGNAAHPRTLSQVPFEELPEKAIAAELTYEELQLFKKIQPRDLLRHIRNPSDCPRRLEGPVAASIKHFNFISAWVSTMILSQEKVKHRAAMLKKFMKIAVIIRESNNYNTLMAIIAGINCTSIQRLRRTWEIVQSKSVYKKYRSLEILMCSEKSYHNYRMALKSCGDDDKAIPYLGIHLRDLVSICEGNNNMRLNGKLHWEKFSMMGDLFMMIEKFQKIPYNIKPNKFIENFINDTEILDEDDLYSKSLELEPKVQRSASTSRVRR